MEDEIEAGVVLSRMMRVFCLLQDEHACITYLGNHFISDKGKVQLGYWEEKNWQLPREMDKVGFFIGDNNVSI
jgi:hypothetical protein